MKDPFDPGHHLDLVKKDFKKSFLFLVNKGLIEDLSLFFCFVLFVSKKCTKVGKEFYVNDEYTLSLLKVDSSP